MKVNHVIYTSEELAAIEKVLDMDFTLENSNGDTLRYSGDYEYRGHDGSYKEFNDFTKAMRFFLKKHQ